MGGLDSMTIHHFISIGVYSLQIGMSYSSKQGFYGDVPQVTLMGYSLMAPWLGMLMGSTNTWLVAHLQWNWKGLLLWVIHSVIKNRLIDLNKSTGPFAMDSTRPISKRLRNYLDHPCRRSSSQSLQGIWIWQQVLQTSFCKDLTQSVQGGLEFLERWRWLRPQLVIVIAGYWWDISRFNVWAQSFWLGGKWVPKNVGQQRCKKAKAQFVFPSSFNQ